MSEGHKKIFWGFIFITFHVNLGNVEVLPNFIGYIIICYGIEKAVKEYEFKSLEQSAKCCSILLFMSFLSLVLIFGIGESITNNIFFNLIWTNIFNIVEMIMIYKLLCGNSEILKKEDNILYDKYNNRISIYIVLAAIASVSYNINAIFMSEILVIFIVVLQLALRLWIILLSREMYKNY